MKFIVEHLQITTKNSVGMSRRDRNSGYWAKLGLSPKFISQDFKLKQSECFDDNLKQRLTGIGGCISTHRKAWLKVSLATSGFYLITEDDSLPTENLLTKLGEI